MSRVAVATCAGENVDPDSPILLAALERHGLEAHLCVWDEPDVEWASFDLTVLRSTWDYAPRRGEFLAWARSVERLANPYEVVEYSSDKHYLLDLAARGVTPADVLSRLAASLGLAEPGEAVTTAELVTRFAIERVPTQPWRLAPTDV